MAFGRARGTLLVLGACLFASGAGAQAPSPTTAPFWTKRHQSRGYAAFHSLALTVKDVPKARAEAEKALAASGGLSTVAAENRVGSDKVGYAQWSYAVPAAALEPLLKKLRKLGAATRDARQDNVLPEGTDEARLKRDRLAAERAAAKPLLDRFPATAAAAQEVLEHLDAVLKETEASKDRVLLNLSIDGPPVPEKP